MRPGAIGEAATRERPSVRALELVPTLALRGITKRWRRHGHAVLDGVDIDLEAGESIWVGGRNGAGKTTLLRIVAGLIMPDGGSIRLQGLDPERDRRRYQTRIGFLPAGNTGLVARLSTAYHLKYWARLAFVPASEQEAAIERALTAFSLHELASSRVDRLSMGQRQRLRAAMAFLHAPELVLLDEPFASLDDEGAAMLAAAVRDVVARGGAAVSCSPTGEDQPELDFDRRLVLEAGGLVAA
jgi:ABC-2 type transport system ATP-binding protein